MYLRCLFTELLSTAYKEVQGSAAREGEEKFKMIKCGKFIGEAEGKRRKEPEAVQRAGP